MSNHDQFETFWQVAGDGALLIGGDLSIRAVNPAAERFLGESARLLKGRLLSDCLGDDHILKAVREWRVPRTGEIRLGPRGYRWRTCPVPGDQSSHVVLLLLAEAGRDGLMAEELADAETWKKTLSTILDSA